MDHTDDPLFYDPFPPGGIKANEKSGIFAGIPELFQHGQPLGVIRFTTPEKKATNPKDAVGCKKAPLHLIPTTAKPEVSLAFLEGALKYGTANWRKDGVRASIYKSALERHLDKWWEGEDRDPLTQVDHMASVIACASILIDARLADKLEDDRPIVCGQEGRAREAVDNITERVQHLQNLFGDVHPNHHTRDFQARTGGVMGLTESDR